MFREQHRLRILRSSGVSLITIHIIGSIHRPRMLERQKELIAVGILFLVLTWLTVSLRVYARAILLKKWGHE